MSLIQQLQDDIVNEHSLESILLKAKILAYRLKHDEFKTWVDHELNGYSSTIDVPQYRRYTAHNFGDFRDRFGTMDCDIPIAISHLPYNIRGRLEEVVFYRGVGPLGELRIEGEIKEFWYPDEVALANHEGIREGMHLNNAWRLVYPIYILQILGTVRSNLLAFVLELQDSFPELAESDDKIGEVPLEQTTNIFNTHIHGGQNVVAAGTNITQNVQQEVRSNDLDSLLSYLKSNGVSEEDAQELKEAVEADGTREESAGLGPRVLAWLGQKTAEGALNASMSSVAMTAAKAVAQYNGWLT